METVCLNPRVVCYCTYSRCALRFEASPLFSCQLTVTPEVLSPLPVDICGCYPDCKVPPSLQEQTNSISPCQSAALRETNLSAETNRDRQ